MSATNAKIYWSADVTDRELWEVLRGRDFPQKKDNIGIKLDRAFLTKYGLGIITEVQKLGLGVFADAKITEIPSKCLEIARLHLEHRPEMLNIMADSCSTGLVASEDENHMDALYRFARLCAEYGVRSCAVSVFTSKPREMVERQYGKSFETVVMWYAKLIKECGLTDVVCSPKEIYIYRKVLGDGVRIVTPGVRLPGSGMRDQKRVMTPFEAVQNGADALVIGSDLTKGGPGQFFNNYINVMSNIYPNG
ncbi:orotidine 5'-phosphate decarboxylase [Candidatus Saccharibacteria bacterium]|nr:orotidine 5'-phosphate decarboxylase [Candidatus Saccharibacteria bacterium]